MSSEAILNVEILCNTIKNLKENVEELILKLMQSCTLPTIYNTPAAVLFYGFRRFPDGASCKITWFKNFSIFCVLLCMGPGPQSRQLLAAIWWRSSHMGHGPQSRQLPATICSSSGHNLNTFLHPKIQSGRKLSTTVFLLSVLPSFSGPNFFPINRSTKN